MSQDSHPLFNERESIFTNAPAELAIFFMNELGFF